MAGLLQSRKRGEIDAVGLVISTLGVAPKASIIAGRVEE